MKTFHLCNDTVKRIISANAFDKIRLVTAGLKAFSRHDAGPAGPQPPKKDLNEDDENEVKNNPNPNPDGISLKFSTERDSALRFTSDGVATVYDFVGESGKCEAELQDLKLLLETYYPLITGFTGTFGDWLSSAST